MPNGVQWFARGACSPQHANCFVHTYCSRLQHQLGPVSRALRSAQQATLGCSPRANIRPAIAIRATQCVAKGSLGHGRGCCKRRPGGRHGRPGVRQRNRREWRCSRTERSRKRGRGVATTRLPQAACDLVAEMAWLALTAGPGSSRVFALKRLLPWWAHSCAASCPVACRAATERGFKQATRQRTPELAAPGSPALLHVASAYEALRCFAHCAPTCDPVCASTASFAVRQGWLWWRKLSSPCVPLNDRAAGPARRGGPAW